MVIISKTMETGELVSFITYLSQILMSLMMISMIFIMLVMSRASIARIMEVLDEEILGENNAFTNVSQNMNLVKEINSYPVSIAWETSDDTIINTDGEIIREDIPETGISCTLTAVLSCGEEKESLEYEICVKPSVRTKEEEVFSSLEKKIKEADTKQAEEAFFTLPTDPVKDLVGARRIRYDFNQNRN